MHQNLLKLNRDRSGNRKHLRNLPSYVTSRRGNQNAPLSAVCVNVASSKQCEKFYMLKCSFVTQSASNKSFVMCARLIAKTWRHSGTLKYVFKCICWGYYVEKNRDRNLNRTNQCCSLRRAPGSLHCGSLCIYYVYFGL